MTFRQSMYLSGLGGGVCIEYLMRELFGHRVGFVMVLVGMALCMITFVAGSRSAK